MEERLARCCRNLPDWDVANRNLVWSRMTEEKRARAVRELGQAPGGFIAAVFPYFTGEAVGNISLYARGTDYHQVVPAYLTESCHALELAFPGHPFRPYSDTSPYPEVWAAASAGLGRLGDNSLLIHPRWGSYVFIGLIATPMELPGGGTPEGCLHCGRCYSVCPGNALNCKGILLDSCVSHLTQKKGELTGEELSLIAQSGMAWGCDLCQTCCPLNAGAAHTEIAAFTRNLIPTLAQEDIPETKEAFLQKYPDRAFTWRGPAVLKRNLSRLSEGLDENGSP